MNEPVRLCDVPQGKDVMVLSVTCEERMRKRLQELGLMEGSRVRPLFSAAFGDPKAYLVREAVLGIRNRDAGQILCKEADSQ